jgi:hypothetical protein
MSRQGYRIAGLTALDQDRNGLENQSMIVAVKIFRDDAIGDLIPGGGIQHQAAKHGLLRLNGMRRQTQAVAGTQGSIYDASGHALP